jgi:hypothetical protein
MTRAKGASGDLKPNATRVMKRVLVTSRARANSQECSASSGAACQAAMSRPRERRTPRHSRPRLRRRRRPVDVPAALLEARMACRGTNHVVGQLRDVPFFARRTSWQVVVCHRAEQSLRPVECAADHTRQSAQFVMTADLGSRGVRCHRQRLPADQYKVDQTGLPPICEGERWNECHASAHASELRCSCVACRGSGCMCSVRRSQRGAPAGSVTSGACVAACRTRRPRCGRTLALLAGLPGCLLVGAVGG